VDKKQIKKKPMKDPDIELLLPKEGQGRDEMKKFYSWNFDDAWQAHEKMIKKSSEQISKGPFFRWLGAQELKDIYKIYRTEKNAALITEAIFTCSLNSLPIPCWCEMAYLDAYRKVRQYKARSWDDVFGQPHPKNVKLGAKADERKKSLLIFRRVKEILYINPSKAIDRSLFGEVGKEFGVGDSLAEKYYYQWNKRLNKKI
jgi:hypothetical protein